MLTVYRSNRAEWLAAVLSEQLRLNPPGPFETVEIVVNTWPTSRWLGEQLSVVNGINALTRFPFPGSHLRQLVLKIHGLNDDIKDSWKTQNLVWTVLEVLPELLGKAEANHLKEWLNKQETSVENSLNRDTWQLAYAIANAFDDYALYRPDWINKWLRYKGDFQRALQELPPYMRWQPSLLQLLGERLDNPPFGFQAKSAIEKLRVGVIPQKKLPSKLYFFCISSLAPIQVELIQALSGIININMFLLTPCPDLWQRCKNKREALDLNWSSDKNTNWLLKAPRLEANVGRLGAEFQQLLEGSGESQLGEWTEGDLFAAPANMAIESGRIPSLLEQIQQQLVEENHNTKIKREKQDNSLLFIACPGQRREVQLVRDQIIQWLAEDPCLEPRDILIMTPQIKSFAPLIASVFNDISATNVVLPWRITDRSQQDDPGLTQFMLRLLEIASSRLSASTLDSLLTNPAIQKQQGITPEDANKITSCLQLTGFRWGLDAIERDGDEIHSLKWCIDRWLLGLIIPIDSCNELRDAAPFTDGINVTDISRWWNLLSELINQLKELRKSHTCEEWVERLRLCSKTLFGNGGPWSWEQQSFLEALEDWKQVAGSSHLKIETSVVKDILNEALSLETGRFGHRTGRLTISALEPMRAIPHKIIVLMGLDTKIFPRNQELPGFHLLEHKHQLGDPRNSYQDRYVILEALMSTRRNLLITWNSKNETTGEPNPPPSPIQQWISQLANELDQESFDGLFREPAPNPLDRSNFLPSKEYPPISCDRRSLAARQWLDKRIKPIPVALALPLTWTNTSEDNQSQISNEFLLSWLIAPQLTWLRQLELKPREWISPLQDLEALDLNELQRQNLLKDRLSILIDQIPNNKNKYLTKSTPGKWVTNYAGQGKFPGGSGEEIEVMILESRWQNLQSILFSLGPCKKQTVQLTDTSNEILWAGNTSVVIDLGKLKSRVVMQGWLQHLQLCASDQAPTSTVIIARNHTKSKTDEFEVALKWVPLPVDIAQRNLNQLFSIANKGLNECWPVPPESGWELAKATTKNVLKAEKAFKDKWNGSFNFQGEREKSEMYICYGKDYDACNFLKSQVFNEAWCSLYEPLIEYLIK